MLTADFGKLAQYVVCPVITQNRNKNQPFNSSNANQSILGNDSNIIMERHYYSNYIASLWSLIGFVTVLRSLIPQQVLDFIADKLQSWLGGAESNGEFRVPQFLDDNGYMENLLYTRVSLYVGSLRATLHEQSADLFCAEEDSTAVTVRLGEGHSVDDSFMGVTLTWTHESRDKPNNQTQLRGPSVDRSLLLRFSNNNNSNSTKKKQRAEIVKEYLEHVQKRAQELQQQSRDLQIYTNGNPYNGDGWNSVAFRHPATFESVALEPELKQRIIEDLDAFVAAKEYYHKLGRAWKRGYLLYGPPGTGKTSTVAAMANYLHYDVYDLELTKVEDNSRLLNLLMETSNRSILLIEDIDCSINLANRAAADQSGDDENSNGSRTPSSSSCSSSKVTLSGMLNFIDGLWSCCGEERIIVFTTNHKDKLDPALLRPGRMDVHLYLGYCTFSVFRELARNYLNDNDDDHVLDHPMLAAVEAAFADEASAAVTPAQVAEILLSHRRSLHEALEAVVAALKRE